MIKRTTLKARLALILGCVLFTPIAKAESVLELFTSHGCYSCPPADALFSELKKENDSLIALEYHVDYWDSLVYGSAGSWQDPFSKPAYSDRQRLYALHTLVGRNGVYTPQAVINGRYAAVGSNRSHVTAAVAESLGDAIAVNVAADNDQYVINVINVDDEPAAADAEVWVVRFIKSVTTEITSGENKGLTVENHNVVTSAKSLGSVPKANSAQFTADIDPDPNMGCAIVIQDNFQSPILAASKCPG